MSLFAVMSQALTHYFAWVAPTETTFDPVAHARFDEQIITSLIEHDEGQIPTLTATIQNPEVGLLAPGRKYWAWVSVSVNGGEAQPLFFGRLIGLPTDFDPSSLTIQIKFIARPLTYVQDKQAVAETLKVLPFYDPIFIDQLKRDDPDAIIEGYSSLYHVDRVTQEVSTSDVLIGEDGTVAFTGDGDAFYESVKMHLDQSPLVAVNVKANVSWSQQWTGFFDVTSGSLTTFTGEAFASDWPTVGSSLGGGYSAAVSFAANNTYEIDLAQTLGNYSVSYHYENLATSHQQGDVMTVDIQYSIPTLGVANGYTPGTSLKFPFVGTNGAVVHQYESVSKVGILNPNATDINGDPAPINIPASSQDAWIIIPSWQLSYSLTLRYEANRKRSERIEFTLQSDVQPTITDALATEDMEAITLPGADVSLPILNLENWQSVAGQAVSLGQYIFPNNPFAIGQTSTQVATTAGTAGIVEPLFSNIAGTQTTDGTVVWTSLGDTQPQDNLPDWQRKTPTALGSIMCPRPVAGIDENSLLIQGALQFPPKPVGIAQFQILSNGASFPGSTLQECTVPGFIIPSGANITTNSPASFSTFVNPTGQSAWLATGFASGLSSGSTGLFRTSFPDVTGMVVVDGDIEWTNIGPIDLPIGGWPGMTGRSSYFPSDRGLQSIGYLLCRARARLRWRSRVAKVTWRCPYANAMPLTCRMNASLIDQRLPGGIVEGKVISYKLSGDGNTGVFYGEVTIGCAAGNGGSIHLDSGTPDYVNEDYVDNSYQVIDGETISIVDGPDDVAFTPPLAQIVDDGLTFPLTGTGDAILSQEFGGSAAEEQVEIQNAITNAAFSLPSGNPNLTQTFGFSTTVAGGASISESITQPNWLAVRQALEEAGQVGVWYSLALRPLTTGPFSAGYVLDTSLLAIPKTIDLESAF